MYISKDGMEISEVLSGLPETLQPLYREVKLSLTLTYVLTILFSCRRISKQSEHILACPDLTVLLLVLHDMILPAPFGTE